VTGTLTEGIYNINKPLDWTSFDVVAKFRSISKIKKVGHAGSLDPLATGVLIVCAGRTFTAQIDKLMNSEKEYEMVIQFGYTTETYDREGDRQNENGTPVTAEQIKSVIPQFVGEIQQVPPMYSAIKVDGKKLYELARAGKTIEREPRTIVIKNIEILNIEEGPFAKATLRVVSEKGAYMRSLAYDIGAKLGVGGYLLSLTRTRVGAFKIADSIDWAQYVIPYQKEHVA
jgi:tRNA pseudouridine55 synthase